MANEEHLGILKQGVEVWNQWREENPTIRPHLHNADLWEADLSGANLIEADLREANLSRANLSVANLSVADLRRAALRVVDLSRADLSVADLSEADLFTADLRKANLRSANLRGTHLRGARLIQADLSGADLSGANFSGADLSGADLSGADLFRAKFTQVQLGWSSLGNVDLSQVEGLGTVKHEGPSTIGIDTIYRSQGRIPESFLRGAGVPDNFITYIASLTAQAFEFYSCFISYSYLDRPFAERLHADLRDKGVRCWYAPEDMKIGSKIRQTIDNAIRVRDKLLVVLSEHSLASAWVEDEVEAAFEEEYRRQQTVLFPVRLDDTVMESNKGWASKLRHRHIGDFRQWKHHDEYEAAFERLLRDLRAEEDRN
jgi:hypothetical protein